MDRRLGPIPFRFSLFNDQRDGAGRSLELLFSSPYVPSFLFQASALPDWRYESHV